MHQRILGVVVVMGLSVAGCGRSGDSTAFEAGRARVLRGEYQQAIPELEDYIATNPADEHASRAGLFLFKAHFAICHYQEARQWCDWTIAQHPHSLEARKCEFKLGLILMAEERFDEAQAHFQRVSESDTNPLRAEATFFAEFLRERPTTLKNSPQQKADQK